MQEIYLKKETKFTFQDFQKRTFANSDNFVPDELMSIEFQRDHLLFKYDGKIVGKLHVDNMRNFCKVIMSYYNIKP